ncbi:hypothetical protein DRQ25_01710 [Candidatus Fermentibacteria bacterium]|nr:MAG: hypothetical protein DRQ25_01710 [Candidatus Fermentibacteria bacterium]
MTYKISGTKSETGRVIIFKESDWSIESNTVISGAGNYALTTLSSGVKCVIVRTNEGEVMGYGFVDALKCIIEDDEWWDGYYDNNFWNPDDPDYGEWDAVNEKWIPAAAYPEEVDLNPKSGTTWVEGFEPSKMRFTIENDPEDLQIGLKYTNGNNTFYAGLLVDQQEILLGSYWQYDVGDIAYFYLYSDGAAEGWAITGIEFYQDTVTDFRAGASANLRGVSAEILFLVEDDTVKTGQEFTLTYPPGDNDFYNLRWFLPTAALSSRKMHVTNIEFYNGGTWEAKFDNTHWEDAGGYVTWNNNRWEMDTADDSGRLNTASGATWQEDYRPTKIRLSYVFEYSSGGR